MSMDSSGSAAEVAAFIDVIGAVLNVPLSLILMSLMKEVAAAQTVSHQTDTFA